MLQGFYSHLKLTLYYIYSSCVQTARNPISISSPQVLNSFNKVHVNLFQCYSTGSVIGRLVRDVSYNPMCSRPVRITQVLDVAKKWSGIMNDGMNLRFLGTMECLTTQPVVRSKKLTWYEVGQGIPFILNTFIYEVLSYKRKHE